MHLELTTRDTKPIMCNYGQAIPNGTSFQLDAVCPKTGAEITLPAVIVDAPTGYFKFERTSTTFLVGMYSATILTTFVDTTDETSEPFFIDVHDRLIAEVPT